MLILVLASIFSLTNPLFQLSVLFFLLIVYTSLKIGARLICNNNDRVWFLSPYIMPVFSYNSEKDDLTEETDFAIELISLMALGVIWGFSLCIFSYPISVGVFIACTFLLIVVACCATAMTYVPFRLGQNIDLIEIDAIVESSSKCIKNFYKVSVLLLAYNIFIDCQYPISSFFSYRAFYDGRDASPLRSNRIAMLDSCLIILKTENNRTLIK